MNMLHLHFMKVKVFRLSLQPCTFIEFSSMTRVQEVKVMFLKQSGKIVFDHCPNKKAVKSHYKYQIVCYNTTDITIFD